MAVSVSIIVPCYNVAPYVDACMDSLVRQTLRDIEIICVNDGSTDGTPVLLHAWEERDSRVRVIDRENGGLSVARNTGMELASGEYIGFVDPDDYVEHSMYARLLEEARRHDAEITGCGYTGFSDGDGMVLEEWCWTPVAGVEENVKSSSFHLNALWMRTDVVVWNKLYRKDFLNRHHLRFETSFRAAEDDVFCLMLLPHATRVAVIPDRLYWYRRQREGSISSSWDERGAPFMIAVERLMHATEYWKKVGWLDSGLAQGWVSQALRVYLLGHFLAQDYPLPQLSEAEWALLRARCRKWFAMVGNMDAFRSLGKWDFAFCRLLAAPPEGAGWLSRALWKFLSRCRGRRGRYYEVCWRLSLPEGREKTAALEIAAGEEHEDLNDES